MQAGGISSAMFARPGNALRGQGVPAVAKRSANLLALPPRRNTGLPKPRPPPQMCVFHLLLLLLRVARVRLTCGSQTQSDCASSAADDVIVCAR